LFNPNHNGAKIPKKNLESTNIILMGDVDTSGMRECAPNYISMSVPFRERAATVHNYLI
jgi:hypothetical protein